jgi:hypothetical protein
MSTSFTILSQEKKKIWEEKIGRKTQSLLQPIFLKISFALAFFDAAGPDPIR